MSNSLDKLFSETVTTVQGYTIRRWHPAVTVNTPIYLVEILSAPIHTNGIQGGGADSLAGTSTSLEAGNVII